MRAIPLFLAMLSWSAACLAQTADHGGTSERGGAPERSWLLHVDNDLFAFADEDRDYTGGVAFTLGGELARTHPLSISRVLAWTDERTRFELLRAGDEEDSDALELGLLLFTPQELEMRAPLHDDRPYANLLYLSSSRLSYDAARGVAHQSSLTFGMLGLPFAGELHRFAHRALGDTEPMGYANQISDGGEPTFRYAVTRQRLLTSVGAERWYSLRLGVGASVGYVTEASTEIALRWGRTALPWWSSPPVSSGYAGDPPIGEVRLPTSDKRVDVMFDTGLKLRARAYNAFLQGQMRDSAVAYDSSQLNHVLLEAWFGVTAVLNGGLSVSYTIRHQTNEIETGSGARGFTWASIGVAQRF